MQILAPSVAGIPVLPRPITNSWLAPWQVLSLSTGTPTTGKCTFISIDVNNLSVNGIGAYCSTAAVGGTYTVTLAIYKDNGRGNGPDLASGAIASGTITPTSTGNLWASITAQRLNGRYWLAFLYYVTASPTTAPQFSTVANNLNNSPGAITGWTINNVVRGYYLTGLTALPTSGTLSGSANADIVELVLRSAA